MILVAQDETKVEPMEFFMYSDHTRKIREKKNRVKKKNANKRKNAKRMKRSQKGQRLFLK